MRYHAVNFNLAYFSISDTVRTLSALALIVIIVPISLINLIFAASAGFPSVFGKGYYLSYKGTHDYFDCSLISVETAVDFKVGDRVVYSYKTGYATGTVNAITERGDDVYVAVTADKNEDSVSVLPSKMVVGVAKDVVPYAGTVIAFFAKYRFALMIVCALIAAATLAELFIDATNRSHDCLK